MSPQGLCEARNLCRRHQQTQHCTRSDTASAPGARVELLPRSAPRREPETRSRKG